LAASEPNKCSITDYKGNMHTDDSQDKTHAAVCKAQMRHGSKSFFAASRLLPQHIRADATALYAFCRVADDAIDLAPTASAQASALAHLHDRLNHIYQGSPLAYAEDVLLCPIVFQHQIPKVLLESLLEGFAWDAQMRRYETLAELHHYATRVAGSVGIMMALMMGTRDTAALEHANALGAAMQLTNIARDIGEDARIGRLYLPTSWFDGKDLSADAFLNRPEFCPAIGEYTERLLREADSLYRQAMAGIQTLPRDCRLAILSAASVYGEIGQQVRANHLDSINQRAFVSLPRKLDLIFHCFWQNCLRFTRSSSMMQTPHSAARHACQHLLSAIRDMPPLESAAGFQRSVLPTQRSFLGRTAWLFEMSERVHEHQRELRTGY
jgi:15-cis-phytoene synthase